MSLVKKIEKIGRKTGIIRFKKVRKLGRVLTGIWLPKEVEIKVGSSSRMIVNPKKDAYYYGYNRLEPGVSEVIGRNLSKGRTFIDVGAYIGFYSMIAREHVGSEGRVVAFEPHPENYKELTRNIKLNNYENIVAENTALSDQRETIRLFIASDLATPSIVDFGANFIETEAISFDEYAELHELKPDLMKIDAEGAEFRIIRGMRLTLEKSHPRIILEVHREHLEKQGIQVERLFTLLEKKGYRLEEIEKDGTRPIGSEVGSRKTNFGTRHNPIMLCR